MRAVEGAGGQIVLPARNKQPEALGPGEVQHGRWPNRFVAKVNDPQAAAEAAKTAFFEAWKKITNCIWRKYVQPVASSSKGVTEVPHRQEQRSARFNYEAEAIWNRQVDHFWEITWVAAPPPQPDQPDPLACRKNWRTIPITAEPGDHCTIMGSWQELSGFIRSRERSRQNEFWKCLRDQPNIKDLDLGEDERLCAIAFIKRMFPRIANETIRTELNAESWLSTPYIAAIPWLKDICRDHPEAAKRYLERVERVDELCPETTWRREDPTAISQRWNLPPGCEEVVRLDRNLLHESALANRRDTPLGVPKEEDGQVRTQLLAALKELQHVASTPSSFYALLLMDGDLMGQLLSKARSQSGDEGEQAVTEALGQFADAVPGKVSEHDGVTVYCGGDDVLAMLPVDSALQCALSLSKLYQSTFEEKASEFAGQATISAGIVFCPFRARLREVIELAHHLLDRVAKDATGRDSLAAAVLKSGGVTCQWAAPWKHLADGDETVLDALVKRLRGRGERINELSSGFLFQIRERFARLTDDPLTEPGRFGCLPEEVDVHAILRAEYVRGRSRSGEAQPRTDVADKIVAELLAVCHLVRRRRVVDHENVSFQIQMERNMLGIDGPLLVRFLASETRDQGAEETTQ